MTTKEQERQAIEKIRKIVEGLGENSYVGFAMEGVLELAEDNIREDTAYSMKKNAEIAWEREDKAEKENKDLKKEVEDLKKTVEKREATISELNTELCNARAEAKANEIPEELVQEMYCMAYDKEAEADGKMEKDSDGQHDRDRYTGGTDQEICRRHSARTRRSEGEHGSRYISSRNIRTGRRRADAAEHEYLERSRKTEESREGPAEDD